MNQKTFKSLFNTIPLTGECEINVPLCVEKWDDTMCISQWKEEYRLCCTKAGKCTISKQHAKELIVELDLNMEQSPVFNSGKTWRKIKWQKHN